MASKKFASVALTVLVTLFVASTAHAESVYFVGGSDDDGAGGSDFAAWPHDGFVMEHLQDLGHDVFYQRGNNSTTAFAANFDLLVISSTLGSGEVRGKFHTISTPILQWEEALYHVQAGNFPITVSGDDANNGTDAPVTEIYINDTDHPLALGLPEGLIEIGIDPIAMPYAQNLAAEIISIARHPEIPERQVFTAFEEGTEWADNTIAPMRMVNFPIQDSHFGNLNEIGLLLFDNSINWLLGKTNTGPLCDFDLNSTCDVVDIDLLLNNLGGEDTTYDIDGIPGVTLSDRDAWLVSAGEQASPPVVLVSGDTDLDGDVDAGDLNNLGIAWQRTDDPGWGDGDFDGNDVVNAGDLNDVGLNWLHTSAAPLAAAVPEPSAMGLLLVALLGLLGLRRR